ncbi:MAG: tail fiber assembly protein [Sphingobium sp.]|nr:tail fiber assembly protein [Sphingobium sp.]
MTRKALFPTGAEKPARIIAADDLDHTDTDGMDVVDWADAWGDGSLHKRVDGAIVEDTAPLLNAIRAERNARLAACDWTQMPDGPLTVGQVAAWRTYRQQLRDLPESIADPRNPIWPTRPDTA